MLTIHTIGHSTRPIDTFTELLQEFGLRRVVDVRTVPRSRHNPQFDRETLAASLRNRDIDYHHLEALGGLRHPRRDSLNQGWRNLSFRGFADYMQTPEFDQGLQALIELARDRPAAIMCAEAVPWRCHRYLIADALLTRGLCVEHILGPDSLRCHTLNPLAVVEDRSITYPPPARVEDALSR